MTSTEHFINIKHCWCRDLTYSIFTNSKKGSLQPSMGRGRAKIYKIFHACIDLELPIFPCFIISDANLQCDCSIWPFPRCNVDQDSGCRDPYGFRISSYIRSKVNHWMNPSINQKYGGYTESRYSLRVCFK